MPCIRYLVSGRVQGVFFRVSTRDRARQLGLTGSVRNMPDGSVEVIACGEEEPLRKLQDWLHTGPPQAKVADVQTETVQSVTAGSFDIN